MKRPITAVIYSSSIVLIGAVFLVSCAQNPTKPVDTKKTVKVGGQQAKIARGYILNAYSVGLEPNKSSAQDCKNKLPDLKKKDWKGQLQIARVCTEAKDWHSLESAGQEMLKLESLSPWGPYFLGLAAQGRGNLPRALWMNELAIRKSPEPVGLFVYQRGRLYFEKNELNTAFESFQEAVKLDNQLLEAHGYLAQTFFNEGEFKASLPHFKQFFTSSTISDPQLFSAFAVVLDESNLASEAAIYLEKGISKNPYFFSLRLQLAELFETKLKNKQAALDGYVNLRELIQKGKIKDSSSLNLADKIKKLEGELKTERMPAQKVSDVKNEKGSKQ